jgi:hypothetical protein
MLPETMAHDCRFEPPDLVWLHVSGDVSGDDIHAIFQSIERITRDHGKIYAIADVRRMGTLSREARKVTSTPQYTIPMTAVLIIGATFTQRTVLGLLDKAYRLLSRDPSAPPMVFVDSSEEAERWIATRRKRG